eukprot:g4228.t1
MEALMERVFLQTTTGPSFARALGRSVGQTAGDVVVCVAQLVANMASIVVWILQYLSGGPQRTRERFAIATAVASDLVSSHTNYVREYERSTGRSYYTGAGIMNTTAGVVDAAVIEDPGVEGFCSTSNEGTGPAAALVEGPNLNDHDAVRRLEDEQAREASAAMAAAQQHAANAARDQSRREDGTFVEGDEGQAVSDSGACAGPGGNAERRPGEDANYPSSSAIRTTSKSKALRKRQKRFEKRFEKEVDEFTRAVEQAHAEFNCKVKVWGEPAGPGGAVVPPFEEIKDARQYPDAWLRTTNDVTTAMRYMWIRNWFTAADIPAWHTFLSHDWLSIYKQLISRLDGEAMVLMQAYVDYVAQELNGIERERAEALASAEAAPAPSRNDTSVDDPDVYAPVRANGRGFGKILPHWMTMGLFWLFEFSQNQGFQLYISFLCMSWGWKVWQAGWNEVRLLLAHLHRRCLVLTPVEMEALVPAVGAPSLQLRQP